MQTKQSMNIEMFRESSVCMCVYCLIVYYPTRRSSLLYIEVWKRRWRIASTHTQRVVWSLLITNDLLLIWLLSYEGWISNPFLVWRNISANRAVILVLLQSTTKVVEKVVVQFVQLSFFNALERISILSFQISS